MLAATDMQMAGYAPEASLAMKKHMLEEAARIPGVTASGITDAIPLRQEGNSQTVWKQDTVDFRISHGALAGKPLFHLTWLSEGRGYPPARRARIHME